MENKSQIPSENKITPEIAWLHDEAGLDLDDALEYTGSLQHLLKFVKTFYESLETKADVIENALDIGDLDLYAIKVHALKSAARIMGAKSLANLAKELEHAAKEGDTETVTAQTDALLNLYRCYKDKLARIEDITVEAEPKPSKAPIADSELNNAFSALREFVEKMDYDAIEMIIAELSQYELPSEAASKINDLSEPLKNYDWTAMKTLLTPTQ